MVRLSNKETAKDYEEVRISPTPSAKERTLMMDYFRKTLTGDEDDWSLRLVYKDMFRFIPGIHRLCELLAAQPIEVAAGPTEERQRTQADMIHEVERELQQLGTGEAFCALLQEDGKLQTARATLDPPPETVPTDPAVIQEIRERSRRLLGRPWEEIEQEIGKSGKESGSESPERRPRPGGRTDPRRGTKRQKGAARSAGAHRGAEGQASNPTSRGGEEPEEQASRVAPKSKQRPCERTRDWCRRTGRTYCNCVLLGEARLWLSCIDKGVAYSYTLGTFYARAGTSTISEI